MAIDFEVATLLMDSAKAGVVFNKCITLGRQTYLLGNNESRRLLQKFGFEPQKYPDLFTGCYPSRYSEAFFRVLGARELVSLDATDYEGATRVHDMNLPVPEDLIGKFDALYDGGTLEHVFNFQTSIRNCMLLVKPGGRVILHTPANNYFGHGFYQFSPELFFRVFSEVNGFTIERMLAIEYGPRRRWFEVKDPEAIRRRGPVINVFPVLLYVQARKVKDKPLFESFPQQSDYSLVWDKNAKRDWLTLNEQSAGREPAVMRLKRALIENVPALARALEGFLYSPANREISFRNPKAFKRLKKGQQSV